MKQLWSRTIWLRRYDLLPGMLMVGTVGLLKFWGHFQVWEWTVFDQIQRWQPNETTDSRILLVGIDETDLRQVGAYPLPDRSLLTLLQSIQQRQPAAIGVDLFRDLPQSSGSGRSDKTALTNFFVQSTNVIGIDKLLSTSQSPTIAPPAGLAPEQVGFADAVLDRDGIVRRSLLGEFDQREQFRLSLTALLAEQYLKSQGIALESGIKNPEAMRFRDIEIPVLEASTGGYVNADAGGIQTLIRFRSGRQPFRSVSMMDVVAGKVPEDWIRGKVVIVGMMAASAKDYVTSNAISSDNPALIYGMEVQAHAVSQLLAAVLDRRALIQSWDEGWDYAWLGLWGGIGLLVGWWLKAPIRLLPTVLGGLVVLVSIGYVAIGFGWWIPIVPAMVAFLANGVVLTTAYRYHQMMQLRVTERQEIISLTFNAIHNGPLQTLATVLRQSDEVSPAVTMSLQQLDRELREIYDAMRYAAEPEASQLYISPTLVVDLAMPLHEILPQIYMDVLAQSTGQKA